MNENLQKFIQKASEDSELQKKIIGMNESILEEAKKRFIKLAEENGYSFTEADIDDLYAENGEVSEDELKAVSGGAYRGATKKGLLCSTCGCAVGGGSSADIYQKTCGCFMGGCGELTEYGKEQARDNQIWWIGSKKGPVAMVCAVVGAAWE